LRAHRSNFKIVGFTEEPSLDEIVEAAHQTNVAVVDDLCSGALLDTAKYGLAHEATVQESSAAGVDVVCFSGDKLLGGPQAGIVAGRRAALDRIRRHPLMRALRVDKLTYAALEATLEEHAIGRGQDAVPVQRMLRMTTDDIGARA